MIRRGNIYDLDHMLLRQPDFQEKKHLNSG